MLEPIVVVTPSPVPNISYKPRPNNKGLVPLAPARSTQGLSPPRSVLSMRALMPLKLSPSTSFPKSGSVRSDSDNQSMVDVDESDVNFNLAELLAQDLEDSKSAFTSKSMTSGSPVQGLAATHVDMLDDQSSLHGPTITRYSSPRFQRTMTRYTRNSLQAPDELDELEGDCTGDRDTRMKYEGDDDDADSASELSLVMEPLSIRTRQQSVTTAATSVSGRCSSFTSPKFPSPASTSPSASFSHKHQQQHHQHQHRQGSSWFDAEDDSSRSLELEEHTKSPPRPSFYFHHRPTVDSDMSSADPNAALRPSVSTSFDFPLRGPSEPERPQTSLELPFMERPRIVHIPPSATVTVPKRKSSLKRTQGRLPSVASLRTCSSRERMEEEIAGHYKGEEVDTEENGHFLNPSASMTMLTTSCGRTVIDASRPSSLELAQEPPPRRMLHPTHFHSLLNATEAVDVDDGDPSAEYIYPERPTRSRHGDVSHGNVHSWLDSGIEQHSHNAGISLNISTPGIPLPPEVLDTLRISISCFPETMLLSSSLSIETIRTYSRKLKHQVAGAAAAHNILHNHTDDSRSIFSHSSHGAKRTKRWHLPKLMSRDKQDKCRHNNNNQNDGYLSLHRSPSISSKHSSPTTTHHDPQPMTPNWSSIKNIFPIGSDYLCDALYAHLVAYNYLNTLCPVPIVNPTAVSANTKSHRRRSGSFPESTAVRDRKVPKKAASILGMQTPLPAPGGYIQFHQFPDNGLRRSTSRRFSGHFVDVMPLHGSGSGSGGIETAVVRDLQAGLDRCIGLLVSTLRQTTGGGGRDEFLVLEEQNEMMGGREGKEGGEKLNGVDGVLMRALCEVVRGSEGAEDGGR